MGSNPATPTIPLAHLTARMIAHLAHHTAERLVRALPTVAADRLAVLLARTAFHLRVPARAAHARNLARLAPERSRREHARLTRDAFDNFALSFIDFLRLDRMDTTTLSARVRIEGGQNLEAAEASGRGVVLLSAHLGNWEWGAAYLASRGRTVRLASRRHDAGVESIFASRRLAFGVSALHGTTLFADAARALRAGEWVALMGDRSAARDRGGSVCGWAAALAQRTHALILPTAMIRELCGSHVLLVGSPLEPGEVRSGFHRKIMREWLRTHAEQWAAFEPLPEGLA